MCSDHHNAGGFKDGIKNDAKEVTALVLTADIDAGEAQQRVNNHNVSAVGHDLTLKPFHELSTNLVVLGGELAVNVERTENPLHLFRCVSFVVLSLDVEHAQLTAAWADAAEIISETPQDSHLEHQRAFPDSRWTDNPSAVAAAEETQGDAVAEADDAVWVFCRVVNGQVADVP